MPKILSESRSEPTFRPRPAKGTSLFVYMEALLDMTDHADEGYDEGVEIMGLMMGKIYRDDIGEYAVVTDTVTSDLESDEVSVRFSESALEELFGGSDDTVVGWYHSHPGFGCYLSETDIKTHTGMFGKDIGFAMVIDPSDGTMKVFVCEDGVQKDASMVVMGSG
jgi:26S proteasome regulatory subunit N11